MYHKYSEIVKTIIFEDIVCDGNSYEYKIEIYKSHDDLYYSRFFRLNYYELIPVVSFDRELTSELIYAKVDIIPQSEEKGFSSEEDSLNFALNKLEEFFHHKSIEQEEINKIYKYNELVKNVVVEDIVLSDQTKEQYKIEVYKNHEGLYYSRFFHAESFDFIVTSDRKLSSEDIYFKDDSLYITEEKGFISVEESLNFALTKLQELYEGKNSLRKINQGN